MPANDALTRRAHAWPMPDPAIDQDPTLLLARTGLQLQAIIDQMQTVRIGNPALDTELGNLLDVIEHRVCLLGETVPRTPHARANWSTSLSDALGLLPHEYNFSVGKRDGVSWAWIQPNDRWQPQEHEARHDHPHGSGLVVAHGAALAMTCAVLILYSRRLPISAD